MLVCDNSYRVFCGLFGLDFEFISVKPLKSSDYVNSRRIDWCLGDSFDNHDNFEYIFSVVVHSYLIKGFDSFRGRSIS